MPRCFVIQPFDGGAYDKRYRDILHPAIAAAGLEAYRVDQDKSSSIPIDDIENGIRGSEICLADITPDNPNIWYEVGFAFANEKPVVMICAKPRPSKPPFDIQHRHIIFYTLEAPSDFEKLQTEITERLQAQIAKSEAMRSVASMSPVKTEEGDLTPYEIAVLVSIMENNAIPGGEVRPWDVQKDMGKAGYRDIATSISFETLKRKEFIIFSEAQGEDQGEPYTYRVVSLTPKSLDWLIQNQDRLKMTKVDEDIPF